MAAPITNELQLRALALLELQKRQGEDYVPPVSVWNKDHGIYVNSERRKIFKAATPEAYQFVYQDAPWRYGLLRGGEGSGKSVHGIVKALERARRGMSGIMVSPDFFHFTRSLWPEFRRWCPWNEVSEMDRRRQSPSWEPRQPFSLHFPRVGSTIYFGGIEDPSGWEGPNMNWAMIDEARRRKDPEALKVLDGRCRIPGPNGERPQLWLTTTPRKHWLFEYFGPITEEDDPYRSFKEKRYDVRISTRDNIANLDADFVEDRARTLTPMEQAMLLDGDWIDVDDITRFLPHITYWDVCKTQMPRYTMNELCVAGMDAGVSSDNFAFVVVSRHWDRTKAKHIAVRHVKVWVPTGGQKLNFTQIQSEIEEICKLYNVVEIAYDMTQLVQMAQNLRERGIYCRVFSQHQARAAADKLLGDMIMSREIVHDGDPILRKHIDNADRKISDTDASYRIIKRSDTLKIDAVIALSMASARARALNLA